MNILMIGNGFDLEHELPTKYTHFLEFVKMFRNAYLSENAMPKKLCDLEDDYLKLIFQTPECEDRVVALHTFTENNLWIEYFQKAYKEHLENKENWIDFESEISSVIQTLDGLIKYYEGFETGETQNESLKNYSPEDELDIIRYNHLLSEIQISEYIDMKTVEFEENFGHE